MVREAVYEDLKAILELYLDLHEKAIPEESEHLESVWKQKPSFYCKCAAGQNGIFLCLCDHS